MNLFWRIHDHLILHRYRRRQRQHRRHLRSSPQWAKIRACSHENRRPNPAATAIQPPNVAEICNDCGIGYMTITRQEGATDATTDGEGHFDFWDYT